MKIEIGALFLAFAGGMVVQDRMSPEDIVWKDYGEDPMANPQFMTDWTASAAVGEQHELLAKSAGEFDVKGKMWMSPDAEPMAMVATAKRHMILGGRYLVEEFKSDFMGMPFEGMMIQGYDNLAKEPFAIWIDSMSTWPSISRGKQGEDGVMHLEGIMKDVMTPGGRPSRSEVVDTEDGGGVMRMFDSLPGGGEYEVMELTYERKKGEKK